MVLLPVICCAQTEQPTLKLKKGIDGIFSLGVRSTVSAFDHSGSVGTGAGGQFRIQVHKRVNTEWFADYITNDVFGRGRRNDYHIGWSVMFYPLKGNDDFSKVFKPYILVGHCFDYSGITVNATNEFRERWSAAVQAGIGTHVNISPRFDISASLQYMMHLGKELHTELEDGKLIIEEHPGAGLEGHLLFTVSVNYKIADLW